MILRWNYLVLILIPVVASQDLQISSESEVTKKVGESAFFMCSTTDSSNPQLKWLQREAEVTKTNRSARIYVSQQGPTRLKLVIKSIEDNDAGPYSCDGVVNGTPERKTFQLSVYTGIKVVGEALQYPIEKTDALIKCQMKADPQAETSWTLPGGRYVDMNTDLPRFKQTQNGLIVTNITQADDGVYLCSGEVLSHNDFKEFRITVKVTILPTMTKPPTLSSGISGKRFNMKCVAEGTPKPKYHWYKDESNIPLGDNTRVIVNGDTGELTIEKLQPEDEGKYKCVAYNVGGQASGQADLNVLVIPTIDIIRNGSADEGQRASIECVAKGKPAPSLIWKPLAGDQLAIQQPSDSRYEIQEDKDEAAGKTTLTLVIKKSLATDIGIYECLAENTAGKVVGKGKITINFKPNFLNTPYAEKFSWPGTEAEIKCVANGNPVPVITWTKNKQPLSYSPTVEHGPRQVNSTIKFKVTQQNKDTVFGIYDCTAANVLGKNTQEINLREATKPGVPGVSMGEYTTTRAQLILTRPSVTGGVDVDRFIVRYLIEDDKKSEKTETFPVETRQHTDQQADTRSLAQLEHLKPSKKYIISVRAGNAVGLSDEFTIEHDTPDLSKPFKAHVLSKQYGENSNQYRLQWDKPDDGGQPIVKYTIKWVQVSVKNNTQSNSWERDMIVGGPEKSNEVTGGVTFFLITGLDAMSYYEVTLTATNALGESPPARFIFRTSNDYTTSAAQDRDVPASVPPSAAKENDKGMSTGAVIGIVIAIFFVLFIIVDVTCYVTSKCGILNLIVEAVQERRTQGKDKHGDVEAGDGDKTEPLLAGDTKGEGEAEEGNEAKETVVDIEKEDKDKELEPEDKDKMKEELEPEDKDKSADPEIEKSDFKPEEEEPDTTEFSKDTEPIAGDKS